MSESPTPALNPSKSPRGLIYAIGTIVLIGLGTSLFLLKKESSPTAEPAPIESANAVGTTDASGVTGTTAATDAAGGATTATAGTPDLTVDESGLSKAVVTIETSKGPIKFRFYTKDAPNTSARIVALVQSGFYNGLTFHRVEPGFVIQGGDPNGNGTGGSGQKLKAEFNARKHLTGTVAMARAQDPDSADSQFYIALDALPMLDGKYTVIGQVSEGMDVVKKIAVGDKMTKVSIQ